MTHSRKVLLVTGGTRGVGAATARLAAARGFAVCINYLQDETAAVALSLEIRSAGGVAHACQADVSRDAAVVRLFSEVDSTLGVVTAIVCNARAPVTRLPIEHLDGDRVQRQLDTDVLGSLLCVREAVQRMSIRRGAGGGAIVFVTPQAHRAGTDRESAEEAATRGAREALNITLAREVAADGIRVNAIRPAAARMANWSGGIANRADRAVGPMALELGSYAVEAAKQILWLISDEAERTSGAMVEVAYKD